MADNEPTISMAGINAPPLYRLVEDGDKTVIMTADTNYPMWVINGDIAGGAKPMTTAERTAITPSEGELIYDTDLGSVYVGDGVTTGGVAIGGGGGGGGDYTFSNEFTVTATGGVSINTIDASKITGKVGSAGVADALINGATVGYAQSAGTATTANGVTQDVKDDIISSAGGGGTAYIGGNRINIDGDTISFADSADIVNVTGTSVTLQPDTAYKIYATSQAITLNANPPAAGKWAYEGHLEIFTAGTGYVVTGSNVVFANALEPDSVNNCTVRFHDGIAIIAVEDHVAGYIVVNGSTSGNGSLYYGIATSTNDYVAFDASLNGSVIPLAGAVAEGEKHLVGNGYTSTTITGSVDCGTSKFTVANLALDNVAVNGGTMTLGDAYIPSGSTVAVSSGGRIHAEKVAGGGGMINLNGTNFYEPNSAKVYLTSCTISGGSAYQGGAVALASGTLTANNVRFVGNSASFRGGAIDFYANTVHLQSCYFSGNSASNVQTLTNAIMAYNSATLVIDSCDFEDAQNVRIANSDTKLDIYGSNTLKNWIAGSGSVNIHSGAILDLTGNTYETPINPGGGISVVGGCTVINSAGASVSIAGGTYTQINNDGTTA